MAARAPAAPTNAWSRVVVAGAIAWVVVAALQALGRMNLDLIALLSLLGPLVMVPLGLCVAFLLDLCGSSVYDKILSLTQLGAAGFAGASFFYPPGAVAASLAGVWFAWCLLFALPAFAHAIRWKFQSLLEICWAFARLNLAGGAAWLVLSRFGATPLGFGEPIVLLTAVHFHFAGFTTAIIAGAAARAWTRVRGALGVIPQATVWAVLLGPGLLAIGFVVSPFLRMFFALFLALAVLGLAGMMARLLPHIPSLLGRLLIGTACATAVLAMVLVGVYAVGEFTERYWLLIPQMARWHGVANAFGFSLCGLFGWALSNSSVERS